MKNKRKLILAIDFDDTITNGKFIPEEMELKQNAKEAINYFHDILNCEIIIWTCRCKSDKIGSLGQAIDFLKKHDIHYDYLNENGSILKVWAGNPRKIFADFYIDDRASLYEPINWNKLESFIETYKFNNSDKFI